MLRATWNGAVLVETDDTVVVEGNHYFPAEPLRQQHFQPSDQRSVCPCKGEASYYDIVVEGSVSQGAAWFYPDPEPASIRGRVAFWRGVRIEDGDDAAGAQ